MLKCQKKLKSLLDEGIQDIILFGSLVKDGAAKDIDLAVLPGRHFDIQETKQKIRRLIGNKADIQIIDWNSVYSSLWLTLIKEGYSLKKEKYLSELYQIQPMVLYKYSLQSLNAVQKVQFERGIKKILGPENQFIARSVAMIPLSLKNRMMEFLKQWNIYYQSQEYELLPVLRKEEF